MSLPIVNAGVTREEREKSERIAKMKGYMHFAWQDDTGLRGFGASIGRGNGEDIFLPNGSFTLDQVAGMLDAEGASYRYSDFFDTGWWRFEMHGGQRLFPCDGLLIDSEHPHDLTTAMDALIKVLEKKS